MSTPPPTATRLERARRRADRTGRATLHVECLSAEGAEALALYAAIVTPGPPPGAGDGEALEAEYLWRSPRGWIVGIGSACRHVSGDLEAHQRAVSGWSEQVIDERARAALRAVGGVAFDAQIERGGCWRGWEPGCFWLPRLMVMGGPDEPARATIVRAVEPGQELPELEQALERDRQVLEAWLQGARGLSQRVVSRETSPGGSFDERGVERWGELVAQAADALRGGGGELEKVVLARAVQFSGREPVHPEELVGRLASAYPSCTLFAIRPPGGGARGRLVGATPERLVCRLGEQLWVDALAGSAGPRVPDEVLLESEKDRAEHQLVIDAIEEALRPVAALEIPESPRVDALANIKHLRTVIRGRLTAELGALALGARLHPTPAVCGRPRAQARDWIRAHERGVGPGRGWYAGATGWVDMRGDGELDVALRCALVDGRQATLFVGAGIVAASEPAAEIEETRDKAAALAQALTPGGRA